MSLFCRRRGPCALISVLWSPSWTGVMYQKHVPTACPPLLCPRLCRSQAMVSLTNIIPTATAKEAGYLAMFLGLSLIKIQVRIHHSVRQPVRRRQLWHQPSVHGATDCTLVIVLNEGYGALSTSRRPQPATMLPGCQRVGALEVFWSLNAPGCVATICVHAVVFVYRSGLVPLRSTSRSVTGRP